MNGFPPLASLGTPRLLVIGDVMLDDYLWGDVSRISPEAPVPVIHARHREYKAGGAGSVVENLAVLGARVDVCALVGDDAAGERLRALLGGEHVRTDGLITSRERPTTCKTRMMAYVQHANRGLQQILRVDFEEVRPPSDGERQQLVAFLDEALATRPDAVLISDYEKGLLDESFLAELLEHSGKHGVPVLVDPGRTVDYARYRGATLICPNRYEAQNATGLPLEDVRGYQEAGAALLERLQLQYVVLTLDREGIYLVQRDEGGAVRGHPFPTRVRAVTDVAGAGDMVLSLLGMALAAGWSIEDAVQLANVGAGIEVSKVGVTPVERWELEQALQHAGDPSRSKVVGLDDLRTIIERARAQGQRVVFTNGCFDIYHPGHAVLLEKARALGEVLVVGLNDDTSVRRLKGEGRPILDAPERARTLSSVTAVDHIVFFAEDTPLRIIDDLRPDVLVKGEDYRNREVVGQELVEGYGGRVELIPLEPRLSTSSILDRIRRPRGV